MAQWSLLIIPLAAPRVIFSLPSTYWEVRVQCYEEKLPPGGASLLSSRLLTHLLQTGLVMKWSLKKKTTFRGLNKN